MIPTFPFAGLEWVWGRRDYFRGEQGRLWSSPGSHIGRFQLQCRGSGALDSDLGEEVGCPLVVVMLGEDRYPECLWQLVWGSICNREYL